MATNTSNINAAIPADNVKVSKADMRTNFAAAKSEIEQLMRQTRLPWQIAFNGTTLLS